MYLRGPGNSNGENFLVGGVSDGDRITSRAESPTESPPTTLNSRMASYVRQVGYGEHWLAHIMRCGRLLRRRLTIASVALVCLCGSGWLATAIWGIDDVTEDAAQKLPRLLSPHGPVTRLDSDPDARFGFKFPETPWYYVGNASSPLPFVVAIDVVYQAAPLAGQRSRYYVLWLFGLKIPLHQEGVWVS